MIIKGLIHDFDFLLDFITHVTDQSEFPQTLQCKNVPPGDGGVLTVGVGSSGLPVELHVSDGKCTCRCRLLIEKKNDVLGCS